MVDTVRDIPLIVENDFCPRNLKDTGFPFDDEIDDYDHQFPSSFESQLDDLRARHPEFAQHFRSFPSRLSGRSRTHQEPFQRHFSNDRPFADRFEEYGFPFEQDVEQEQKPQSSFTNPEPVPEENKTEPERGRRPSKNIQQSNTVDLGKSSEQVDDRSPRSMSAPPPNNRNMPQNEEKTQSKQPTERIIPIHVEGRDEPIISPKFASQQQSQPQQQSYPHQHQQSHPQQQGHPQSAFFSHQRPSDFFNRNSPFTRMNMGFTGRQTPPPYSQSFTPNSKPESQGQAYASQPKQQEQQHANEPQQSKVEPPQPSEQPKQQKPEPKPQVYNPIDQIKAIQKDVSELMIQVEQFSGKPRDKQYLYLDEMLTRNLIKLDNIDTQGQENIRSARKEAIKCIEKCISLLESKASANVGETPKQQMEVDKTENKEVEKMEEVTENKLEESTEIKPESLEGNKEVENNMEIDKSKEENTKVNTEEKQEPMEIAEPADKTEVKEPAQELPKSAEVNEDTNSEKADEKASNKKEKGKKKSESS